MCAALPPLCPFTISAHAQSQTLLQAAVLTAVAVGPVDQAVPLAGTRVHGVVLLTAAEEALHQENGYSIRRGKKARWKLFLVAEVLPVMHLDPHLAAFAGDDSIVDP